MHAVADFFSPQLRRQRRTFRLSNKTHPGIAIGIGICGWKTPTTPCRKAIVYAGEKCLFDRVKKKKERERKQEKEKTTLDIDIKQSLFFYSVHFTFYR
jgi:hypothetical protein